MALRVVVGLLGLALVASGCGLAPDASPGPTATQRETSGLPEPRSDTNYPAGTVGAFLASDAR